MERKGDIRHFLITMLMLSVMGNIGQYFNLKDQSEQYKVLEYSYHADTADRGYCERLLLDSINNVKTR